MKSIVSRISFFLAFSFAFSGYCIGSVQLPARNLAKSLNPQLTKIAKNPSDSRPATAPKSTAAGQANSCLPASQNSSLSAPERIRELRLPSKLMKREMPYCVILPPDYSDTKNETSRYSVIFLLHGLYGHYDNWVKLTRLVEYSAKYSIIIVTPEGNNGWYVDSATKPDDKYESYIINELIPEIDAKFRTVNAREKRAIAGLSMGGYGAIKFGLKYPRHFLLAGSFSGALGAASFGLQLRPELAKPLSEVFGPADSNTRRLNDIFLAAQQLSAEDIKNLPFLYLDCGTEDFLFQNNREFIEILLKKKIPHEWRQLPGQHNWKYWDQQIVEFLELADNFFKQKQ
jgi:S-formylglutathione hydrolase FrmB